MNPRGRIWDPCLAEPEGHLNSTCNFIFAFERVDSWEVYTWKKKMPQNKQQVLQNKYRKSKPQQNWTLCLGNEGIPSLFSFSHQMHFLSIFFLKNIPWIRWSALAQGHLSLSKFPFSHSGKERSKLDVLKQPWLWDSCPFPPLLRDKSAQHYAVLLTAEGGLGLLLVLLYFGTSQHWWGLLIRQQPEHVKTI